MKYLMTLCSLFLFTHLMGQGWQGRWDWQLPTPAYQSYYKAHFLNERVGYVVTNAINVGSGRVMKTEDGGLTWKKLTGGEKYYLTASVNFSTGANGFLVNRFGELVRTQDGGISWTTLPRFFDGPDTIHFNKVEFINPNLGFGFAFCPDNSARMYRTLDGGTTWTKVMTIPRWSAAVPIRVHDIDFSSATVGYAVGSRGFKAKTADGGATWTVISPVGNSTTSMLAIAMVNDSVGVIHTSSSLLRTRNRWRTWTATSAGSVNGDIQLEAFSDSLFVASYTDRIAISTDQCQHWTTHSRPDNDITSMCKGVVLSPNRWMFFGSKGQVFKTVDGGTSYTLMSHVTQNDLSGIHFSDDSVGYAVGGNETILKTTDGGIHWRLQHEGAFPMLAAAYRFAHVLSRNEDTAWAVGPHGLAKTTNGGATWSIDTAVRGFKIEFPTRMHGYIQNGTKLLESLDGGATWAVVNDTMTTRSITFITEWKGIGVNIDYTHQPYSRLAMTVDGGRTWQYSSIGRVGMGLYNVSFTDSLHGFAGVPGKIYCTRDGGRTWQQRYQFQGFEPQRLWFADSLRGWAVRLGDFYYPDGFMASTVDGGYTWELYPGVIQRADEMYLSPNGPAWYVSTGGSICYFDTSLAHSFIPNRLTGTVIRRRDQNCAREGDEYGFQGMILRSEPGNRYASTNAQGRYFISADTGVTKVSLIIPQQSRIARRQACPDSGEGYTVNFGSTGRQEASGLDFFFDEISCPFVTVSVSSDRWRPCFPTHSTIVFRNSGEAAVDDVKVYYQMPPMFRMDSASVPFEYDSARKAYIFSIGTLGGGENGAIHVWSFVPCNGANIGQTACARVWLTPGNRFTYQGGCLPPPVGFDQSEISIRSFCRQDSIAYFSIRNLGRDMDGPRAYRVYKDTALVLQNTFSLGAGDSLIFFVPRSAAEISAGIHIRTEADQHPRHPFSQRASASDNCSRVPTGSNLQLTDFDQDDAYPAMDTECNVFRGSMDPNDKTVSPAGVGPEGKIRPGTQLEYLIRFQNYGNDTAYTVAITDTLPEQLDLTTLEMASASHPYTLSVTGDGRPVLHFFFNDIDLVDSATNEAKSHGFVAFQIKPNKDLPLGTRIENRAHIVFDFNDPIATPATLSTLYEPELDTARQDSVILAVLTDLQVMGSPRLSPAVVTGCDTSRAIPTYVSVINTGMIDRRATDTVTIRLRDETTGQIQTYRQPLGVDLASNQRTGLAVPFAYPDVRDYRLWAKIGFADDYNPANDSTLIELPYGKRTLPAVFRFDTCAPGQKRYPVVRGFDLRALIGTIAQPDSAWLAGSTPEHTLDWRASATAAAEQVGTIVTLPVGPLGQHPVVALRWRGPENMPFVAGDSVTLYARTVCGGRQWVGHVADSAGWPRRYLATTYIELSNRTGLGPDSVAAIEVAFHLMPTNGRSQGADALIQIGEIRVVDSLMVASKPQRAHLEGLRAQPNPAQRRVTLLSSRSGRVEMTTVQGQLMATIVVKAGEETSISLAGLPPGLYILRQDEMTIRLVKE